MRSRLSTLWLSTTAAFFALGGCFPFPASLEETGLYADVATGELAAGVREYRPRFELWSDGAQKRRFALLPDGETLDTSDMDAWRYPVGTKLFKEFRRGNTRLETRMLEKREGGEWTMIAYLWNGDGTAATAVPEGTVDAHNTPHDVPELEQCGFCHDGAADRVLGFTALQLAHDDTDTSLQDLVDDSLLSDPPADAASLVWPAGLPEVFGHLHANCGTCHNAVKDLDSPLRLAVSVAELGGASEDTAIHTTTVDVDVFEVPEGAPSLEKLVVPGDPDASMLHRRATTRGEEWQMPPLATETVDGTMLGLLEDWIESL